MFLRFFIFFIPQLFRYEIINNHLEEWFEDQNEDL